MGSSSSGIGSLFSFTWGSLPALAECGARILTRQSTSPWPGGRCGAGGQEGRKSAARPRGRPRVASSSAWLSPGISVTPTNAIRPTFAAAASASSCGRCAAQAGSAGLGQLTSQPFGARARGSVACGGRRSAHPGVRLVPGAAGLLPLRARRPPARAREELRQRAHRQPVLRRAWRPERATDRRHGRGSSKQVSAAPPGGWVAAPRSSGIPCRSTPATTCPAGSSRACARGSCARVRGARVSGVLAPPGAPAACRTTAQRSRAGAPARAPPVLLPRLLVLHVLEQRHRRVRRAAHERERRDAERRVPALGGQHGEEGQVEVLAPEVAAAGELRDGVGWGGACVAAAAGRSGHAQSARAEGLLVCGSAAARTLGRRARAAEPGEGPVPALVVVVPLEKAVDVHLPRGTLSVSLRVDFKSEPGWAGHLGGGLSLTR